MLFRSKRTGEAQAMEERLRQTENPAGGLAAQASQCWPGRLPAQTKAPRTASDGGSAKAACCTARGATKTKAGLVLLHGKGKTANALDDCEPSA